MSLLDELKTLGLDIDAGLVHFKGNAAMFERLIKKFPSSTKGLEVLPLLEKGDIKQAYMNAHSLKGVCANLYITPLYNLYAKVSDSLKVGNSDGVEEILAQVAPLQEKIISVIESA